VSDPGFDPFRQIPFLGDLAKMIGGQGPISWDAARQLAVSIATGGETEANVDPLERIRFEELGRVAELHVATATGLPLGITRIEPVTASQWALRSLEAYRPLFEGLAGALGTPPAAPAGDTGEDAMLSGLLAMLSPVTLGMSAGSMVGHLARRSFGQYDLPIPRLADAGLLVLPHAINSFASDWSLPIDDLRLWVCVHELTHHAVFAVPHVRATLTELLRRYVSSFRSDPRALEEALGGLELEAGDPMAPMQQLFWRPELLLGAMTSDEQRQLEPRLDALVAVIVGFVDDVLDQIATRLIASHRPLAEAVRRHRVEADQSDVFVARLLGLSVGQAQVDRGHAFVSGVRERAGDDGLARLWRSDRELPTPAEVDAPGLWLARIDLAD
jgi:putative hydrolase